MRAAVAMREVISLIITLFYNIDIRNKDNNKDNHLFLL